SYRVLSVQAEDGIRHRNVTGVQTCALPILPAFVISAILYWVVGATLQSGSGDLTIAQETMTSLEETFNISWVMLIPAAIVIVLLDRKSTRLNSSHVSISYAVFCLKNKIDDR